MQKILGLLVLLFSLLSFAKSLELEIGISDDENDKKDKSGLKDEIREEWGEVTELVMDNYNKTITFFKEEFDHMGMSREQIYGVAFIFTISSVLLLTSFVFLCCGSKGCCQGRRLRDEEKYIVYRRMVEIDHIIALEPSKSDQGKLPI